jgi:hypothetical protein
MCFSRLIQWYHSHADTIWPDGTYNPFLPITVEHLSHLSHITEV